MKLKPTKYQLIQLIVPAPGITVTPKEKIVTDKLYRKITGIYATSNDALAFTNSFFEKFEIDKQEIYPVGFDVKLISACQEQEPKDKFDDENQPVLESVVEISYIDLGSVHVHYPYTVNLYLRLEKMPLINHLGLLFKRSLLKQH